MSEQDTSSVRSSYDIVADEYVRRIYDELRHKPFDREMLDRFADRTRGLGLVCDLGCGPGHIARYLHDQCVRVFGIDLSPAMVDRAARLNPGMEFYCGDMLSLSLANDSLAGIAAFYAIVNVPPADLPRAAAEMFRVLAPGGVLLLSFHIGSDTLHLDQWWEQPVSIDFFFFPPEQVAGALAGAGFAIDDQIHREPYPEVEHQSRRAYIVARKP